MRYPVPNPDVEIRGTGTVIQTLRVGGARSPKKKFFGPLGDKFGLKIRGGRAPRAPALDPPLIPLLLLHYNGFIFLIVIVLL